MMSKKLFFKNTQLDFRSKKVTGQYVQLEGEPYYKISGYDGMHPFFMSLVSDSDHWMFISSNGGLSAGRKNSDHALFPYYSDDKISDDCNITGSKTIVHVVRKGTRFLWEPFSSNYAGVYHISRNLFKNFCGDKILFEEINHDLGLTFTYSWKTSDKFGFVKQARVSNNNSSSVSISLLDGIQNILPSGVDEKLQKVRSNLIDAYKKNEADPQAGLGLFSLSAVIIDRPVPSESLTCNLAYAVGIDDVSRLVSVAQLDYFRANGSFIRELDIKGERGAYFVNVREELETNESRDWLIVADVNKDHADVVQLNNYLKDQTQFAKDINRDVKTGSKDLIKLIAKADGMQCSNYTVGDNRHFANVLFNVMRGGIPDCHYRIPTDDFKCHLSLFNKKVHMKQLGAINSLPESLTYRELLQWATESGNLDLQRLATEYLPFIFSRRHGDPSRPWNRFSIDLRDPTGKKVYNYEGNWRDIFQNWEALAVSFPHFINGMIAKFVSASTLDGYNPYRITKEGIDWEVIEPDDPWSFIGYWGDHQVIYLQKLLEISIDHQPSGLKNLLTKRIFSSANVPYTIKSYSAIVANARDTIEFDDDKEVRIKQLVHTLGADGKMVLDTDGDVYKVTLTEKLLIMILTKFSNFIPGAGIWLNTQRPEWNDANNALVGNGVSMVTLYYMFRFLRFAKQLFSQIDAQKFEVSSPLKRFLESIMQILLSNEVLLQGPISDTERRSIMDELGTAGESYRKSVYTGQMFQQQASIDSSEIREFIDLSIVFLRHTIEANRRADGLYHAYNLIDITHPATAKIKYLYEMLEGQVGILSAGILAPDEAIGVLKALKKSTLFREDQYSYILYPDKELPRFQQKNRIPLESLASSELLQNLIADGNKALVYTDSAGGCHFNTSFNNNENLKMALAKLRGTPYEPLVDAEEDLILNIYEEMFDHKSFTGRSGTFFGYEGLGSIYWHMVSKLRLAVYENYKWAGEQGAEKGVLDEIKKLYYDIENGLGNHKGPQLYGAFPMDPYSHTPAHRGAQQPGMTGQVKEDILARFGELGVGVKEGKLRFSQSLLRKDELLTEKRSFEYINILSEPKTLTINEGCLAFTYCMVPVIYSFNGKEQIRTTLSDGTTKVFQGLVLPLEISNHVFDRNGTIQKIQVDF